nr:MAG TPA: hypothetical protein [Caudoviricetes sp.]
MSNANKRISDVQCETCSHSAVCAFKETYSSILDAISNVAIDQPCTDGKKVHPKKITDFDFIDIISVVCRYYCPVHDANLYPSVKMV